MKIRVEDNGCGIPAEEPSKNKRGILYIWSIKARSRGAAARTGRLTHCVRPSWKSITDRCLMRVPWGEPVSRYFGEVKRNEAG